MRAQARPASWPVYQWNGDPADLEGLPTQYWFIDEEGVAHVNGNPINLTDWVIDMVANFYMVTVSDDTSFNLAYQIL